MANRKKRENNKDRLIETTIRHIEKLGADKISLRKIAAECGVTHASIYKHFQDKQALIEATYPYILNRIYPFIQKEIDGRPKENAFLAMCKGYMKFMVTYPQYHYLLHISPSSREAWRMQPEKNIMKQFSAHYTPLMADFLEEYGIPSAEGYILIPLIVTILEDSITLINKGGLAVNGDCTRLVDLLIVEKLNLKRIA